MLIFTSALEIVCKTSPLHSASTRVDPRQTLAKTVCSSLRKGRKEGLAEVDFLEEREVG